MSPRQRVTQSLTAVRETVNRHPVRSVVSVSAILGLWSLITAAVHAVDGRYESKAHAAQRDTSLAHLRSLDSLAHAYEFREMHALILRVDSTSQETRDAVRRIEARR